MNARADPARLAPPSLEAKAFHESLPGYRPTPVHELPGLARELGLAAVLVKDESDRLGLPAFKILGASWAAERALRERPQTQTLVAGSAGNHGRAVARVAAMRGLRCRIFLPARALPARREAIAAEGAEVVVVDGPYEEVVERAEAAARRPGAALISDVGEDGPARWVIDGYATMLEEAAAQARYDLVLVPVGVGSLAAAVARHGAAAGAKVVGVEPVSAACLAASLLEGAPASVPTPGTIMAGMDCAEVSPAAWPVLRAGVHGVVAVADEEVRAAMGELEAAGLAIGECGAAPLAALRVLLTDPACRELRDATTGPGTRALLLATEGRTGG